MARRATTRPARSSAVSEDLRAAIEGCGDSDYQLGERAGVDRGMISRFMRRERSLSLDAVDRLAGALGLRLVAAAGRRTGRVGRRAPGRSPATPAPEGVPEPCPDVPA